jgi:hypothetical protein
MFEINHRLRVDNRFDYEGEVEFEFDARVDGLNSTYINREQLLKLRDHLNKLLDDPQALKQAKDALA